MKRKLLVCALVGAATATPALAAGNWYVMAAGGVTHADSNKGEIDSEITAAGLTLNSSSLDSDDAGYKLQLGYQFNPYFAIEGGYVNLGKYNYTANVTGGTVAGDAKVDGWNLGLVGTWPVSNNWGLFARLGMIDSKVKGSITGSGAGGTASVSAESHKWRNNFGLGATWMVMPNLGVRLEYEEFYKVGDKDKTGESDIGMLSLGLSYRF